MGRAFFRHSLRRLISFLVARAPACEHVNFHVAHARTQVQGHHSGVAFGHANYAAGFGSAVSGGLWNSGNGRFTATGGGARNAANGYSSSVGGGEWNTVCARVWG